MLSWTWLRIGRRIELVMGGLLLLGLLIFTAIGLSSHHPFVGLFIGAFISLVILTPLLVVLLVRRRREAKSYSAMQRTPKRLNGLSVYGIVLVLTLVSAMVQATHQDLVSFVGSIPAVYLWNVGLFVAVVGLNKWAVRTKRSRPRQAP